MSAWIPAKEHFDAIIEAAARGPREERTRDWSRPYWRGANGEPRRLELDQLDEVGDMLVRECVRSVSGRYPDNGDLPGPLDPFYLAPYKFPERPAIAPPQRIPTAVEAIKLVHCLEYQSCEHDEWESSEARAFCQSLRTRLELFIPGYDEAPWAWDEA